MKYTQDWFTHSTNNFNAIKNTLKKVEHILEIGCFEGMATCWMLEKMLDDKGVIQVIDTFGGGEEHTNLDLTTLRQLFESNVAEVKKDTQDVRVIQDTSYRGIAKLIGEDLSGKIDFIYVDGSHIAPDVLTDACMAFGLLRQGGIMLFDDYLWSGMPGLLHRPKIAIDFFTTVFAEKCAIHTSGYPYQLAIQKV